jgi:hypothetical protein
MSIIDCFSMSMASLVLRYFLGFDLGLSFETIGVDDSLTNDLKYHKRGGV